MGVGFGVRVEGGLPEPIHAEPVAASGDAWSRISLEEYLRPPGEEPPATPLQHTLLLNIGDPYRREHQWADEQEVVRYTLEPGCAAIIPAGARYRSRWLDPGHVLLLTLEPSLLAELTGRPVAQPPALRRVLNARDGLLTHLMLSLREALREDPRRSGPLGEYLARAAAFHLASYLAVPGPSLEVRAGLPSSRLRRITDHVEHHLEAPLSLRDLASLANLSLFHFARSFKESTGLSPHQYILRRRVDRAKQLLGGSSLSLAEIALRCGFSHQSHFTKAFRQITGVTPTRWREPARARTD
jgi:AraC family transcriptional regulator